MALVFVSQSSKLSKIPRPSWALRIFWCFKMYGSIISGGKKNKVSFILNWFSGLGEKQNFGSATN